ncbi:MAG: hypothetical protein SFV17_05500 [Candidatus Obscuribacter sp.]|nr:hypothetical protein [Candidatus Obscuribacter sp.]
MREDMKYLMLDRPRVNHKNRQCKGEKRKAQRGLEFLPLHEPMKRRFDFHCRNKGTRLVGREDHRKQFSDYYAPILRFLRSRVGRKWDDVNSEIRREADSKTVLGFHLVFHVKCLVRRSVYLVDGRAYSTKHNELTKGEFYVHPDSGLLCQVA